MKINIGDKFVATKKMWLFDELLFDEGTEVTVTGVHRNGIVYFTFGESNANEGYADIDTFAEHFKKVTYNELEELEEVEREETLEITQEYIAEIMENSEFETFTTFNKCTIVSCRLPNGFVITESSACVNTNNYNAELAEEICFDKIAEKIWELEAYRLQQFMWEEGLVDTCVDTCTEGYHSGYCNYDEHCCYNCDENKCEEYNANVITDTNFDNNYNKESYKD